jgi:hypothetical protein
MPETSVGGALGIGSSGRIAFPARAAGRCVAGTTDGWNGLRLGCFVVVFKGSARSAQDGRILRMRRTPDSSLRWG